MDLGALFFRAINLAKCLPEDRRRRSKADAEQSENQ